MGVRYWLTVGVLGLVGLTWVGQAQAEVYRWKDASGRIIYGDNPPEELKTAPLDLPPLTISDGAKAKEDPKKADPKKEEKPAEIKYESFEVTTPKKDESLRANDGAVTIELEIKPALQPGHSLVLYLDGKQEKEGVELSYNFTNVDRGTHTTFAVVKDRKGEIVMNTEVTTFHVLRAKKKRKLETQPEQEAETPSESSDTPSESQSGTDNSADTRYI